MQRDRWCVSSIFRPPWREFCLFVFFIQFNQDGARFFKTKKKATKYFANFFTIFVAFSSVNFFVFGKKNILVFFFGGQMVWTGRSEVSPSSGRDVNCVLLPFFSLPFITCFSCFVPFEVFWPAPPLIGAHCRVGVAPLNKWIRGAFVGSFGSNITWLPMCSAFVDF